MVEVKMSDVILVKFIQPIYLPWFVDGTDILEDG